MAHTDEFETVDGPDGGVVQLRYRDSSGETDTINAASAAEALQGIVELTANLAKKGAFGEGMPPEVRLRPVKEGSVVVETVIQWAVQNPEGAFAIAVPAAAPTIVGVMKAGIKSLRGTRIEDFDHQSNGSVKVRWSDDSVDEIPAAAWAEFKDAPKRTKKALKKIMAPMSGEADVLEIRSSDSSESSEEVLSTEASFVASRADYRAASAEPDDIEEQISFFEAEAQLESIDFRTGERWRIATTEGTRTATIEDEDFLRKVDRGFALHKDDLFTVTIRQLATTKNGRTTRDWFVTKVVLKRRGNDDGQAAQG
jgi:hypothetical protein